jgi:hypothetical protein
MIGTTTNQAEYAGNASPVTAYIIPFRFDAASWVRVTVKNALGEITDLEQVTDYTLGGNGASGTGTFTTVAAVPATSTVTVYRETPGIQTLSLPPNTPLPATAMEAALDRLAMAAADKVTPRQLAAIRFLGQDELENLLNGKAPLASPTFTGTVSGITASMVGLGNVNNTSDANKPVSTAQQNAINLKANLASPALTGTPTAPTPALDDSSTRLATTEFVKAQMDSSGPAASDQPLPPSGVLVTGMLVDGEPITLDCPVFSLNNDGRYSYGFCQYTAAGSDVECDVEAEYDWDDDNNDIIPNTLHWTIKYSVYVSGTRTIRFKFRSNTVVASPDLATTWTLVEKSANVTGTPVVTANKRFLSTSTEELLGGKPVSSAYNNGIFPLGEEEKARVRENIGVSELLSNKLDLSGGSFSSADAGLEAFTSYSRSVFSGSGLNVEHTGNPSENASLQYNGLQVQNFAGTMAMTASGLTFPNSSTQTTAFPGFNNAALTGNPTAPTPATSDNDTSIATTAFVKAQGFLTSAPVSSVAGKTGAVTLDSADITDATSAATANTLVKRNTDGDADFYSVSVEAEVFCKRFSVRDQADERVVVTGYSGGLTVNSYAGEFTIGIDRSFTFFDGNYLYGYSLPLSGNGTIALSNAPQTFTADQTFSEIVSLSNPEQSTSFVTGALRMIGGACIGKNLNVGGAIGTAASTTTTAGLNVPHGAAPTSPVNGDVWTQTVGLFARINGSTRQFATLSDGQTFSGNNTFAGPTLVFGNTTAASTVNIGTGATLTATTKAINIGTNGVSGSTTNITLGSATSGATNLITVNGPMTVGNNFTATGLNINIGNQTATAFYNFGTGALAPGQTRTIGIGTNALTGSTNAITIGSTAGTSSTTLNGSVTLAGAATLSGATTVVGTASFTNAARPTVPNATGSPDATSLMTRNDVDAAAFDDFGEIIPLQTPTLGLVPTGGSSQSTAPDRIADLRCGTLPNGFARATFNRGVYLPTDSSGASVNFSSPCSFAIRSVHVLQNTTCKTRIIIGGSGTSGAAPATADNPALSDKGFGVEIGYNGSFMTIAAFAHNGTTFIIDPAPKSTGINQGAGYAQYTVITVSNNGSGTITAQAKQGRTVIATSTTTGGPTGTSATAGKAIDLVVTNGLLNAANQAAIVTHAVLKLS